MATLDFRTDKQKERDINDQRIRAKYESICHQHADLTPTRIMKTMAKAGIGGYTSMLAIRASLIRSGAYTPTPRS